MSADLLRRAAKALREHAGKATRGPWQVSQDHDLARDSYPRNSIGSWVWDYAYPVALGHGDGDEAEADARYCVLMHPPVALALADWLDVMAEYGEFNEKVDGLDLAAVDATWPATVAVARAILREAAPA